MIISMHRIITMNPTTVSMLKDSQIDERIDLDRISNNHQILYKEIVAYCHSRAVSTTKSVCFGYDSVHTIHVFMHRLCYFPCRILIMVTVPI